MIKRVSELMLGGYESVTYYCTLCCRPFKPLHEANEHARFCGQAVLAQPTPDDDDDTQVYKKPWVGLTPEEVLDLFDVNNVYGSKWIEFARTVEAALKKKKA
jgi:hypothetical protein